MNPKGELGPNPSFSVSYGDTETQLCLCAQHGSGPLDQWSHTSPGIHTSLGGAGSQEEGLLQQEGAWLACQNLSHGSNFHQHHWQVRCPSKPFLQPWFEAVFHQHPCCSPYQRGASHCSLRNRFKAFLIVAFLLRVFFSHENQSPSLLMSPFLSSSHPH